jgi:hypothetical protein
MSFGIYFSCDVTGDAIPDPLALNDCGRTKLLLVLIKVVGEVVPLLGEKFSTE